MTIDTKKTLAIAALIAATGVAGVELTRSSAQAESRTDYAVSRIDTAFHAVDAMPAVRPVSVPMATKGDLPVPLTCFGESPTAQAECMDVVYEVPSGPSFVVEVRNGTTSTLTRMDAFTVADFAAIFQDRASE